MSLNMGRLLIARCIQACVLSEHRAGKGSGNDSDNTECFDGHDAFPFSRGEPLPPNTQTPHVRKPFRQQDSNEREIHQGKAPFVVIDARGGCSFRRAQTQAGLKELIALRICAKFEQSAWQSIPPHETAALITPNSVVARNACQAGQHCAKKRAWKEERREK